MRQSLLYKQILPGPIRRSFSEGGTPTRLKSLYPLWLYSLCSLCLRGEKICEISVNPWLINDLRLRKITYEKINLFLQNEPNFRKSQVNVTAFITINYVQMDTWSIRKNEPKTNPILANKTPIRTQFKPKQTQFQRKTMPNLTITPQPMGIRRFFYIYGSRAFYRFFGNNPGDKAQPARISWRLLSESLLCIFFSSVPEQVFQQPVFAPCPDKKSRTDIEFLYRAPDD